MKEEEEGANARAIRGETLGQSQEERGGGGVGLELPSWSDSTCGARCCEYSGSAQSESKRESVALTSLGSTSLIPHRFGLNASK